MLLIVVVTLVVCLLPTTIAIRLFRSGFAPTARGSRRCGPRRSVGKTSAVMTTRSTTLVVVVVALCQRQRRGCLLSKNKRQQQQSEWIEKQNTPDASNDGLTHLLIRRKNCHDEQMLVFQSDNGMLFMGQVNKRGCCSVVLLFG